MIASVAPPVFGLLLCGGASRRMQRDKAQLHYGGEPQLVRAWRLLQAVTARSYLSLRAGQLADPLRAALPHIVDRHDAIGPAAGILSAQQAHPEAAWLVIACDLPLLGETTLRQLLDARDANADATAFASGADALPEPLCALWEPSSHASLARQVSEGRCCPRRTLLQSRTKLLPAPGDALANVNTPEAFLLVQQRIEAPS